MGVHLTLATMGGDKKKSSFLVDLTIGGISGAFVKTIMSPVERIKILMQTQDSNPKIMSGEVQRYYRRRRLRSPCCGRAGCRRLLAWQPGQLPALRSPAGLGARVQRRDQGHVPQVRLQGGVRQGACLQPCLGR